MTITAHPLAGFSFDHWEGDLSGADNPAQIVVTENSTVTAVLVAMPRYSLVVNIATPDSGTVTLSPLQPEGGYLAGDNVSLTADAAPGYVFSHWEGSLEGSANPYQLLINDNESVTAVFYSTVEVICSPSNDGTVTLEPAQASGYAPGTEVSMLAIPEEGYVFDGWSGDVSGTDNPVTMTVDSPKAVTANFVEVNPFPWRWVIIGVLGLLLVALLAYFVRTELSKS